MTDTELQHANSTCPQCGACQLRDLQHCWLCDAKIPRISATPTLPSDVSSVSPEADHASQPFSYSLSTLMLIITLVSVCCGLLAVAPGLAVPICVLLVPVFVRTAMVVRRREDIGKAVSPTEKVSLFLGSFAVATVILVVVLAATVGSFCAVCLSVYNVAPRPFRDEGAWTLAIGVSGVIGLGLAYWMGKWVRTRYRRDVGEPVSENSRNSPILRILAKAIPIVPALIIALLVAAIAIAIVGVSTNRIFLALGETKYVASLLTRIPELATGILAFVVTLYFILRRQYFRGK